MKQALLLAALLAAAPAFAQTYVTGQVGRASHTVSVEGTSLDDNDTAFSLAAGYRATPNFAVEAGYINLGKFEVSGAGYTIYAKPSTLYGALVGTIVATPQFGISAKLGVARHSTTVGYRDPYGDSGNEKVSKTGALFGLGASFALTPGVSLVAEYTHFGKVADNDGFDESIKSSLVSAGVRFTF